MIKTYPSKAAYEAAEKSVMESTVSFIENTNSIAIDGVNVVTEDPKVGDIVCYDENRKIKFIALDTFQAGTFPAAWETVGVVALRKGNTVTVCSKHNEYKKFMEVYPYIVSGCTLDGEEHIATLKLHGSDALDFKYAAKTDTGFLEDLLSFLATNNFSDWSAYGQDGKTILQYNGQERDWLSQSVTYATGIVLTEKISGDMPEVGKTYMRKCGTNGQGVWHSSIAKYSFKNDLESASYNPTADINSVPSSIVCYPAFCGTSQYRDDHCLWLRQRYCKDPDRPTQEDWERYVDDIAYVIPCMTAGNGPSYRDGKRFTDSIRDIEYLAPDGMWRKLYPAAVYCSGFLKGRGTLPSMETLARIAQILTYGLPGVERPEADPVNRSLYAIGGDPLSCAYSYWLSSYANGDVLNIAFGGGTGANSSSNILLKSLPVAELELPLVD